MFIAGYTYSRQTIVKKKEVTESETRKIGV